MPQLVDGSIQVFGLRKNGVLENGLIGHECIHGGYALYRGIQVFEQFVGDAGGDFCSVAPAQHIFVGDDHPAGLLHRRRNRVPVVGAERAQIEQFHLHAQLAARLLRGAQRPRHHGAIGDDREVLALAATRLALPKGIAYSGPG